MIGRLTDEEWIESCRKHHSHNLRRLTDEEYDKLQEREKKIQKYLARENALAERMRHV